jgi:hypothetical protein
MIPSANLLASSLSQLYLVSTIAIAISTLGFFRGYMGYVSER